MSPAEGNRAKNPPRAIHHESFEHHASFVIDHKNLSVVTGAKHCLPALQDGRSPATGMWESVYNTLSQAGCPASARTNVEWYRRQVSCSFVALFYCLWDASTSAHAAQGTHPLVGGTQANNHGGQHHEKGRRQGWGEQNHSPNSHRLTSSTCGTPQSASLPLLDTEHCCLLPGHPSLV